MDEKEKCWQDELKEKYPKLLKQTYPSVGEGWKDLLDNMLGQIQHYMKWCWENEYNEDKTVLQDGEEPPETGKWIQQPEFTQIKEKFSGLRAYYYGGDERIRGIVDSAEGMSYRICEICGNKGEARNDGWRRTLCTEHHEVEQARQEARRQEAKARKAARNAEAHT
tara:strand:+ start:565 stop:1062 length:498 start_codon:yes stop_codon:yes gene_type:complete